MFNEKKYKLTVRGRQLAEENLSASIKDAKAELKQTSKAYQSSLWALFETSVSAEKSGFEKKLQHYGSLLAVSKARLSSYQDFFATELVSFPLDGESNRAFNFLSDSTIDQLKIKIKILEGLVGSLQKVIASGYLRDAFAVYTLEHELAHILDQPPAIYYLAGVPLAKKKKDLSETLRKLRSRLRFIVKHKVVKKVRDLRQFFRTLVHQLFKNMSDVSGDDVLLSQATKQSFFIHQIKICPSWIYKK